MIEKIFDRLSGYGGPRKPREGALRMWAEGQSPEALGSGYGAPRELSELERQLSLHEDTPETREHWSSLGEITPEWEHQNPLRDTRIDDYVEAYRGGRHQMDGPYLSLLWDAIGRQYPSLEPNMKQSLLANIVAVSQAESGMGGDLPNRQSNYWGWFKDGNKRHDPDRFTMADQIVEGIGGYTLGNPSLRFSPEGVRTYTGKDKVPTWLQSYEPAMTRMGY